MSFTLDVSQISGISATGSTLNLVNQNGTAPGTLTSYVIDNNGVINGAFDNGITRTLGQVAPAQFPNTQGLVQAGQNNFTLGVASGLPQITAPGTFGAGTIQAGALEQSNTNIGKDLVNLIVASTNYQGNAKVIGAVNQLVNVLSPWDDDPMIKLTRLSGEEFILNADSDLVHRIASRYLHHARRPRIGSSSAKEQDEVIVRAVEYAVASGCCPRCSHFAPQNEIAGAWAFGGPRWWTLWRWRAARASAMAWNNSSQPPDETRLHGADENRQAEPDQPPHKPGGAFPCKQPFQDTGQFIQQPPGAKAKVHQACIKVGRASHEVRIPECHGHDARQIRGHRPHRNTRERTSRRDGSRECRSQKERHACQAKHPGERVVEHRPQNQDGCTDKMDRQHVPHQRSCGGKKIGPARRHGRDDGDEHTARIETDPSQDCLNDGNQPQRPPLRRNDSRQIDHLPIDARPNQQHRPEGRFGRFHASCTGECIKRNSGNRREPEGGSDMRDEAAQKIDVGVLPFGNG